MKIPRAQDSSLLSVELAQPGKQHGADRHIDANPEGVRPTNDFQQSPLRELFNENAVLRQQACMVQTNAVPQPFLDFGAVGTGELHALQRAGDGRLFFFGGDINAREVLRALRGLQLREVHDIDGNLAIGHQRFDGLRQGQLGIGMIKGDRPIRR